MDRIASRPPRGYRSELRQEQTEETRARILDAIADPRSLDELRPMIRALLERLDNLDDLSRAAMASPGAAEVRHATMPTRLQRIRRVTDTIEPKLRKADRERITRLIAVLMTSSSLRMWRDHLGLSVDEVADEIDWIVRAAIFAIEARTDG